MTPLGIRPRDVIALARNARAASSSVGPIVVSGPDAAAVVAALGDGAKPGALVVRADPAGAVASVRVVAGTADTTDREMLRAGARAAVPLVALVRDHAEPTPPYVLATDVVVWPEGAEVPVAELARVLVTTIGSSVGAVAAAVPALRETAVHRQTLDAAATAASLALMRGGATSLAPVLALHQAKLLRDLASTRGVSSPSDPEALARIVGPELGAAVVTGLVSRGLVRRLPFRNRLVEAAVAFGGTAALVRAAGALRGR